MLRKISHAPRLLAGVCVVLGAIIVASACSSCTPSEQPAPIWKRKAADKVYTTRAQVESLPDPKRPTAQFVVHHEAIDEFANPDGTRGMSAMTMPMITAQDLSLTGLAVGDKIELDLSVWNSEDGKRIAYYQVSRIKKLPPETELKFERAAPTLGAPPASPTSKP